jgi:hypothetical protein
MLMDEAGSAVTLAIAANSAAIPMRSQERKGEMYNYHGLYNFSDRKIDQLCELTKRWAVGDIYRAVDARKYTKQVKEWGQSWTLLERRGERYFLTNCLGYKNISHCVFQILSLPIEVLWRLVQPMLREDGSTGYSIVNNVLWMSNLGVAPQTDRFAADRELREKEDVLLELSAHHYIHFQMAGSVWSISREERVA